MCVSCCHCSASQATENRLLSVCGTETLRTWSLWFLFQSLLLSWLKFFLFFSERWHFLEPLLFCNSLLPCALANAQNSQRRFTWFGCCPVVNAQYCGGLFFVQTVLKNSFEAVPPIFYLLNKQELHIKFCSLVYWFCVLWDYFSGCWWSIWAQILPNSTFWLQI